MARKASKSQKQEPIRHTHATINGLEDALANVLNVISELEIAMIRAKRLLRILQVVRKSPYAYQRGSREVKKTILYGDSDGWKETDEG